MKNKTKIIATIGPSSESAEMLDKLYDAGVNIIRLNFSHGDYREHEGKIDRWNEIISHSETSGAVMADLAGPEIRTGEISEAITFAAGDSLNLTPGEEVGDKDTLYINYEQLATDVSDGTTILIDDGKVVLEVTSTDGDTVATTVTQPGTITSGGRGVNVPGIALSLPSLTDKDLEDLKFSLKKQVDFVAISFVKNADDIHQLREEITSQGAEGTKIVAKIETQAAVDNIDEIIEATDCIMVARGDLAVEVSLENVPIIQKQIIQKCNTAGVPVITATQMLESMTSASTPTRAEASDVANAILDGSDAIMLSGETAMGEYPVETVEVMSRIAAKMETQRDTINHIEINKAQSKPVNALTASVVRVADDVGAKAIVALTDSGFTARMISRYRPVQDILAFSSYERTCRQLSINYGCQPRFLKEAGETEPAIKAVKELLLTQLGFESGDKIVVAAGVTATKERVGTNALLIVEL
ncbi:MAG: pyruvate kinase [Candidatus Paceibacterota bacterium]